MGESSTNTRGPSTLLPLIPAWLDDKKLSVAEFRIYCRVARRAGWKEECTETVDNMAKACKLNRDTVWKALKNLRTAGLIIAKHQQGQKTRFILSTNPLLSARSETPDGNGGVELHGNGGVEPSGNGGAQRNPTKVSPLKAFPFEASKGKSAISRDRENQLIKLAREILGEDVMQQDGGKWRNRVRAGHRGADKVERVLNELRAMQREGKGFDSIGGYAEVLWEQFAE